MLQKRYLSQGKICEVTFILPPSINAKSAVLVGDFNNWNKTSAPMTSAEGGTWQAKVNLNIGREYQFRYFVNGSEWHNDWEADKYVMNPYGGENSVVIT
ncbi:MAG: isoamylase early set domain-containing protein [Anaerolineae bacterium]|nr:isoamylase early set domain-containing protein [Anaerolineae bacterium]